MEIHDECVGNTCVVTAKGRLDGGASDLVANLGSGKVTGVSADRSTPLRRGLGQADQDVETQIFLA